MYAGSFDMKAATKTSERALAAYKEKRGIPAETMIYKVIGAYHAVRDELNKRGWIEHDWEPEHEKDHFMSCAWNFLYAIKGKDTFRVVCAPF